MAKADATRDYYADLELNFGAAEADIKKQFKKLALKYHPDRNPGREAEVNSKFQTIQAAHEVLIDPEQRAKYDAARLRNAASIHYSASAGTASGTRGNPWSNAGSQWPPPPRPTPPRDSERRRAPPPTSAGAQRWSNFAPNGATPKPNVDAESRQRTYRAWESMKPQSSRSWASPKPVPKEFVPQSGREESNSFKHAPPPKSSRPSYEEFRASTMPNSPRTSPSRNSGSNNVPRKNGFMPGNPDGDEPPAMNTSAYSNYRSWRASKAKQDPPDPPPRNAAPIDPMKQSRDKTGIHFEPRLSTPYTTHGGEKTNPFEAINTSRPRSTRDRPDRNGSSNSERFSPRGSNDRHRSASPPRHRHHRRQSSESNIPHADSGTTTPKRSANKGSKQNEPSQARPRYTSNISISSSSDSEGEEVRVPFSTRHRAYARPRPARATRQTKEQPIPPGIPNDGKGFSGENQRKPTLGDFKEWWSSRQMNSEPNYLHTDVPTSTHPYPNPDRGASGGTEDDPKMYSIPNHLNTPNIPSVNRTTTLPTAVADPSRTPRNRSPTGLFSSETVSSEAFSKIRPDNFQSQVMESPHDSPSGVSYLTPPNALNPFEAAQFKLVEQLVGRSASASRSNKLPNDKVPESFQTRSNVKQACGTLPEINETQTQDNQGSKIPRFNPFISTPATCAAQCSITETGSPCKKQRATGSNYCASHLIALGDFGFHTDIQFGKANKLCAPSFSFGAANSYFPSGRPPSNSAENISTTFASEDWKGKFEAGDFFGARKVANGSRARSGSRTRTRSPTKRPSNRPKGTSVSGNGPHGLRESKSADTPVMSQDETKFNAEEWAKMFKPQTFAPSSFSSAPSLARPRQARRPSKTSPTTSKGPSGSKSASSTTINEDGSSDEVGLHMGNQTGSKGTKDGRPAPTPSPNAMDIDPPLDETPKPAKNRENSSGTFRNGANEARNVPLEPSRPEWRAGDANGVGAQPASTAPKQSDLPPRQAGTTRPRRRATKSTDSEDFKTNFEELRNVEPLHNPATGLHSFNDIASSLPFQSKASTALPFSRNFGSDKLELPPLPRAPIVPPIAPDALRPSASSWQSFLAQFTAYMAQWNIFNSSMVNHFIGRKNQVAAIPSGWLEAFGDGTIEKYMEGLKQDEEVRVWWDIACSKHRKAVEEFQWFRGCMREGVQNAGLPPKGRKVS